MSYFIIVVSVFGIAYIIGRIIRFFLRRFFQKSFETLNVEPTNYLFFQNGFTFIMLCVASFICISLIPSLKSVGAALFTSAGIVTIIVGFAAQQALSNIISGIFIVIFKPFRVDDLVTLQNTDKGIVEDINLRHTIIKDFNSRRIIIPNSLISSQIIVNSNIVEQKYCKYVEFKICFEADIELAMSIIQQVSENHDDCLDNRTPEQIADQEPIVRVRVVNMTDYSILLRAYIWVETPLKSFQLASDVLRIALKKLKESKIPFPRVPYFQGKTQFL